MQFEYSSQFAQLGGAGRSALRGALLYRLGFGFLHFR
jgi:hypothetical protein